MSEWGRITCSLKRIFFSMKSIFRGIFGCRASSSPERWVGEGERREEVRRVLGSSKCGRKYWKMKVKK